MAKNRCPKVTKVGHLEFESQIFQVLYSYLWPFNKFNENQFQINALFVFIEILGLIRYVLEYFRYKGEKFTTLSSFYSPTTYRIPSVDAVWNMGASPDTSHRYCPVVLKSTLSSTISLSVDNRGCNVNCSHYFLTFFRFLIHKFEFWGQNQILVLKSTSEIQIIKHDFPFR